VEGSAVSLIYETKKPSINEGFIEIRRNPDYYGVADQ